MQVIFLENISTLTIGWGKNIHITKSSPIRPIFTIWLPFNKVSAYDRQGGSRVGDWGWGGLGSCPAFPCLIQTLTPPKTDSWVRRNRVFQPDGEFWPILFALISIVRKILSVFLTLWRASQLCSFYVEIQPRTDLY